MKKAKWENNQVNMYTGTKTKYSSFAVIKIKTFT